MAHYKRKGHRGRSKVAAKSTQGAGRAVGNSKAKGLYGEFSRGLSYHQSAAMRNVVTRDELE